MNHFMPWLPRNIFPKVQNWSFGMEQAMKQPLLTCIASMDLFPKQGNKEKCKELFANLEVDWTSNSTYRSCVRLEKDQDEWNTVTGTCKSILELQIAC
jgi:hypothetical protein